MPTIYLSLLGKPEILRDQVPVEINIAKVQALLAYLAATSVAHSRDHLLSLLWAESHPEAARKNLRNRLWQLRQTLGEEVIVAKGDWLALAESVQSDLAIFEQGIRFQLQQPATEPAILKKLLDLWRGALLDDIHLSEAPDFELWLTSEREHLGQLYLRGLNRLLEHHEQMSEWSDVVALAQQGLRHDPLQESLHQALMRGYAQQGKRNEALRQYEQLRQLLQQELGVEPMPATTALRQQISQTKQDPPQPKIQNPKSKIQNPKSSPSPFIGRQSQLALLDHALEQAAKGGCRVVLLGGEMGIGKSRLWRIWADRLSGQSILLETRCLNTTQRVPFDPLRRLLNDAQLRRHFAAIQSQLLPVWRNELLHLAPGLQQKNAARESIAILPPTEERSQVAEALTQLMRSFAAMPLILFVDDLHWADEATLNWLLYLCDRMAHESLLLVAAYRPQDASPTLNRIIAQWQREGMLQRVQLPNFTLQESAELLAALGNNRNMADYLHSQSGGNPYYLTQLSDVAVDGVPATLAELIQARLRYLPEHVQPILHAAAVLEPNIDLNSVQQTSQRGEEETLDALDLLLSAGVLSERAAHYEFTHPLVATVVRDNLSNGRRKLYHRRAAEGIAHRHQQQLATVAGQLAHHYNEAGEQIEAARFAETAGEEALRVGAIEEAVRFFQQANELDPTPARQLGLGKALVFLPGKLADARTQMEKALDQYSAQQDCRGIVKTGLRLAVSYIGTQEGEQVLYWTRRVLPDLETVDDPELQASAHYLMGTAKFRNGYSLKEAINHYSEATRLATAHHLDAEIGWGSWFEWGNLYLHQGDYAQAIGKFERAKEIAKSERNIFFEAMTLNNLAYTYLLMGDLATAQATITSALHHAETYVLLSVRQFLYSTSGEILLALGEIAQAEQHFQQALQFAQKYENHAFAANLRAHLGRVAQAKGDFQSAEDNFLTAKASLNGKASHHLVLQIELWLVKLYLVQGKIDAARQTLQQVKATLADGQYEALSKQANTLQTAVAGQ